MEAPVGKSGLDLEGDKEEAEEGDDDEDVSVELARSVVGEKPPLLPPGYSISEGWLACDEEWDKTVEV